MNACVEIYFFSHTHKALVQAEFNSIVVGASYSNSGRDACENLGVLESIVHMKTAVIGRFLLKGIPKCEIN